MVIHNDNNICSILFITVIAATFIDNNVKCKKKKKKLQILKLNKRSAVHYS